MIDITAHTFVVKNGIAKVVSPYEPTHLFGLMSGSKSEHRIAFEKSNTFSTNAPDNTYSGSSFEEVWQFRYKDDTIETTWSESTLKDELKDYTFEQYQKDYPEKEIRIYLKLIVKDENQRNHFYLTSDNGVTAHVNMDPNADKETFDAVKKMVDLAYNMPEKDAIPPAPPISKEEQIKELQERVNVLSGHIHKIETTNAVAMEIENKIRTQVDEPNDFVYPYLKDIYDKLGSGNFAVDIRDYQNSNDRLTILKVNDKTIASVIETRTEFNHIEYVFASTLSSKDKHIDELEKLLNLALEIDFMTTVEFCNKYRQDHPSYKGSIDLAVMEMFAVDSHKWHLLKDKAKEINKALNK